MGKIQQFGNWVREQADKVMPYTPWGVARVNTDRSIAANKELAEYQYSKDLEMWQKANEYGSPQAQMERLKGAGLNPNMVYGSGSAAGASPSQLPKYQAPNVQYAYKSPVDLGSVIGLYQDVALKGAQIENVKANTRSTNAGSGQREMDLQYRGPQSRAELADFQQHRAMWDAESARWKAGVAQNFSYDFASESLRQSRMRSEGMMAENLFKRYRNQWMAAGVTSSDNPILRMLVRNFSEGNEGLSLRRTSGGKPPK